MTLRRVLLVSYFFPPVGGAGVQRASKFAKYLPAHGWQASVLTVKNPSVPTFDDSLTDDIPPDTVIRKARTLEPGYAVKQAVSAANQTSRGRKRSLRRFCKSSVRRVANAMLQPDPQVLWLPAAVRAGRKLLNEVPHEAIIATGPPFSSFLVGALLSRSSGVPLLLDYRDEWDISNSLWENKQPGRLSLAWQHWQQRFCLRAASAVVATTQASAETLQGVCRRAGSSAVTHTVYNGFDPAEFSEVPEAAVPRRHKFRLAYVGTLWNLTSVEPLVNAVRAFSERNPRLAERLEIVFAGRRTAEQESILDGLNDLPCEVVRHPYVDHAGAIELMRSSDGLCLLLSDREEAGRVVPAKLFEYLAARRPILAIGPPGEVRNLLDGHPAALLYSPANVAGIAEALALEIERQKLGLEVDFAGYDVSRFDRRSQAGSLATVLDQVAGTNHPKPPVLQPAQDSDVQQTAEGPTAEVV